MDDFVLLPALLVLAVVLVLLSYFTVRTSEVAIVERFGKFSRTAQPGLNFKIPLIENVAGRATLRVSQITRSSTCWSPISSPTPR
jgi:regulator of protease activity HflC (stomatin/prohibitin superfamily)